MALLPKLQRSLLGLIVAGFATALALPAWAFSVDFTSSGDGYRAEVCGLSQNTKVVLTNGRTGQKLGGRAGDNGCFKTTFKDANSGDNILISVNDGADSSYTIPKERGNAGGSPSTSTPAPSQPTVDLEKVRKNADNNARCTANQVVATYGAAESYRYNMRLGMQQALQIQSFSNIVFGTDITRTSEYADGVVLGQARGEAAGREAGTRTGQNDGSSRGSSDATARFAAVIDTNNAPDKSVRVPSVDFTGLSPQIDVMSFNDRMQTKAAQVEAILRDLSFTYDGYVLRYDVLAARWGTYYLWRPDYSYETISSWYRADWAFSLFTNETLGSRCENGATYYSRLPDARAQAVFEQKFKATYDRVIDEKFIDAVRQSNPAAQTQGAMIARAAYAEHAQAVGVAEGTRRSYQPASVQGYRSAFAQSYETEFQKSVQRLDTSAILTSNVRARLTDNSGGQDRFIVGLPVHVVVDSATNIGRQEGEFQVSVASSGLDRRTTKSFRLRGSTSNRGQAITLDNIATVSMKAAANSTQSVTISIGNKELSTKFELRWETQLLALTKVDSTGTTYATLLEYASQQLKSEFEEISGTLSGNHYKDDDKNETLLEQMAKLYRSSDAGTKALLATAAKTLAGAIGERPTGWFEPRMKAKWDTAKAIFDSMK